MDYKLLHKIIFSNNDKNIKFIEIQKLLDDLGFNCRIKGDHFIYYKDNISEIVNIQPLNKMAKPYQIKQIKKIILKYNLGGTNND